MAFQNRQAFGDIYTIPTTPIDNIAKMVYREQQVREQQKLQQDKALDDEFAKNVAGVKSADIPEITSAYNDFKQAHIALQKKGAKATPQDQMDVMIKKANAFQAINASKEDKDRIKNRILEVRADKKGLYNPDAHTALAEMLNTPTSKRKPEEDDDRLKYKYAMPNIDKEIANAAGKGQDIPIELGIDPADPLKNKREVYKTINPPNTFYNNLFTGLAARSDNKGFVRSTMDNMTDDEKEKLRVAYEAKIQDPKFKALYGDVQPFPASAANTELGQAAALKTMEAFVNLPIDKPTKIESIPNTNAVMDKRNKFAMEQQGRGFAHAEKMAGLRFGYSKVLKDYTAGVDAAADDKVLNTFIKNTYYNSKDERTASVGGKQYKGRLVDLPKDIKDKYIYSKGNTDEAIPDTWLMTEDKQTLIPLFYGEKTTTGGHKLKVNPNSKPIDIQNFKVDLGKLLVTQKQRGEEAIDQFDVEEPKQNKKPSKPTKADPLGIHN